MLSYLLFCFGNLDFPLRGIYTIHTRTKMGAIHIYLSIYIYIYIYTVCLFFVLFFCRNSDIWRDFPKWIQRVQSLVYLNNEQGSQTTVAAAVAENLPHDHHALYLQPYSLTIGNWNIQQQSHCLLPNDNDDSEKYLVQETQQQPAFPPLEMLGPFVGPRITPARLPTTDGGYRAAAALREACEELTNAQWDSSS